MAHKIVLIDDLDGESSADETVRLGIDGSWYELDLTNDHAKDLRDRIALYMASARRVPSVRPRVTKPSVSAPRPKPDKAQLDAMRQWGKDHGWEVTDRGRVPVAVQEAYHAAMTEPQAKGKRTAKAT